jgi:hypothetical protein
MRKQFESDLLTILGLTCWGAIAGEGTGSMITLDFGERIPITPPLRNETLSNELRHFQGQYCIFVEGCSWRLEEEKRIICSWGDAPNTIGREVERLVGCQLTKAELPYWTLDLRLSFDDKYVLYLFCDQTTGALDNYSIRFPFGWYSVRPQSKLSRESTGALP